MTSPDPVRRKRRTVHERIDRRLPPRVERIDERTWIRPERITTISLPPISITTVTTADLDADLGLASDHWDQMAAERMLLDACARRRSA